MASKQKTRRGFYYTGGASSGTVYIVSDMDAEQSRAVTIEYDNNSIRCGARTSVDPTEMDDRFFPMKESRAMAIYREFMSSMKI